MLVFIEVVFSSLVNNLVAYSVFTYLALKRLVTVIEAVRCLITYRFTPKPTSKALKMNKFDCTSTQTDVEERIKLSLMRIKAYSATSFILRIGTDSTLSHRFLKSIHIALSHFDGLMLTKETT